ncbi:MAG: cytochrome c biogenesis protein CcsA, partial [Bacteroidota bacterium]
MDTINYIGEHLAPRYLGHFAILLGFMAALVSTISFAVATNRREKPLVAKGWGQLGRVSFVIHGMCVFLAIAIIFYLMLNKYYEFQYVQAHVSDELPPQYVFAAFWEGQEGSFLLWMFWHVVLGIVVLLTAKQWERPVLAVISSVQVVIMSMLLGIYVGFGEWALKLGSNPLLLLREVFDAPIFRQADYVDLLPQMAQGLNPSLQNYWMTIHPPTLFLGFASTVVPFAFAIAGLWTRQHKAWLRPALKWSLFSAAILGTGILMGGAWAYEALNFGGYWAWDPVENTSLVPWLLLVAGIHTNLIAKATGQAIKATYVYYLLTFVLIIYSTFLTRSGVLGDTSVHAFTEMGLESQLLFFLGFFTLMALVFLATRWREVPTPPKEESAGSKEFWMFIGSLVLFMSATLITGATSLPVFNEIAQYFNPGFSAVGLEDPEAHHNRYQLWIGVFIGVLSGVAQFMRWREQSFSKRLSNFVLHGMLALIIAAGLTALTLTWIDAKPWQYKLLLFSGWYAVASNLDYIISFVRKDMKLAGSALSHVGFGVMVVGIMASGPNQRVISKNQFLMEGLLADEELARTSLLLYQDTPLTMENYRLSYVGDSIQDFTRTYFVNYEELDRDGAVKESFQLAPTLLYDRQFSKIAIVNPATKHYWDKDIFTVIMSIPEEETSIEAKQAKEDSLKYRLLPVLPGASVAFKDTFTVQRLDTTLIRNYEIELTDFKRVVEHPDYVPEANDIGVTAYFTLRASQYKGEEKGQVAIVLRDGLLYHYPAQIEELNTRIKIDESIFEELLIDETQLEYKEYFVEPGETFEVDGQRIYFSEYLPNPEVDHYRPMEGDISVSAVLMAERPGQPSVRLDPVFVIRNKQAIRARDHSRELGLYVNFINLNPENNQATL